MFSLKKRSTCDNCKLFMANAPVKNPEQLSLLIADIKTAVSDGILVAIPPKDEFVGETFRFIPTEPPWPDIILNYFRCKNCAAEFKLYADTYHGSNRNGWSRVG